jgi:hypothetical protein
MGDSEAYDGLQRGEWDSMGDSEAYDGPQRGSGTLWVIVRPMTVLKGGVRAGMARETVLWVL